MEGRLTPTRTEIIQNFQTIVHQYSLFCYKAMQIQFNFQEVPRELKSHIIFGK